MSSRTTIVVISVVVGAIAAAGLGLWLLFGPSVRVGPSPTDTITAAATDETGAKAVVDSQFRADFSGVPSDATILIDLEDVSTEYWKATATHGTDSKKYWVPKEKPKAYRVQVGQSVMYKLSGTYSAGGMSGSISGTFSQSVPEKVTYKGTEHFKTTLNYNVSVLGIQTNLSGYAYVDDNYRPSYTNMTIQMGTGTTTMEYEFNYDEDKMIITYGERIIEQELPSDAFFQQYTGTFLSENLYVGWSDNFTFSTGGTGVGTGTDAYTITFSVDREEQITVPAGTFRCYVITGSMSITGVQMSFTIWINAQMTLMPKMEANMSMEQVMTINMTMVLESYSGY